MPAQVDHLDDAPARLRLRMSWSSTSMNAPSISMHGPAVMVLATRTAHKRSALTHMRAHTDSRGLVRDATRSNPQNAMALAGRQT
eukprot:277188-Prymnesium_polylepis.1